VSARNSKVTDEVKLQLLEALLEGVTRDHAASIAGLTFEQLADACRDPAFALEVAQTEALCARGLIRRITRAAPKLAGEVDETPYEAAKRTLSKGKKGGGNWKAAAWLLERRFPQYATKDAAARAPRPSSDDRPFSPWKRPDADAPRTDVQ